jgi:hypothetical protein
MAFLIDEEAKFGGTVFDLLTIHLDNHFELFCVIVNGCRYDFASFDQVEHVYHYSHLHRDLVEVLEDCQLFCCFAMMTQIEPHL